MPEHLLSIQDFIHRGGLVMPWLLILCGLMWFRIIERYWYLLRQYPEILKNEIHQLQNSHSAHSWHQQKLRQSTVSLLVIQLKNGVSTIQTMIRLAPLLGLLGTITGMIKVFDTLSLGQTDINALSSGISAATLPTMAGLVIAISGYYFQNHINQKIQSEQINLQHCLRLRK
jgi:biopolymer transport protein ExbB